MSDGKGSLDTPPPSSESGFVKGLGLLDSTMLVMGTMIGSGIFIVSADIGRQVGSPGLLLIVWLATILLTLIGALSYGELAAAMPHAGGQYVFLREALGPLWGFLYGWSMLFVIQTATIAAVGIAFAKFTGVIFPWFSPEVWIWKLGTFGPYEMPFGKLGPYDIGLNRQNLLAIVSILFLTGVNSRGVRTGAIVQNTFTLAKTGALAGLIVLGFIFTSGEARKANLENFWGNSSLLSVDLWSLVAVAMVGSLFSADSWNNVTFTAAEVKDPARNLPRALALGTGLVGLLYLLANVSYLGLLPLSGTKEAATVIERGIQHATQDRVGTAAAEVIFGQAGATIMAVAIMISTFGCNNGLILSGARIYFAMARDGLFFASAGRLNRASVPGNALMIQAVWASVFCLSGTYGQLLDFVIFAVLIFYILTIVGLFILRVRRPDLPRPYKALGYPVLPAIYIAATVFIEAQLLIHKPEYTWPGLIIVLLGIPVYWIWRGRNALAPPREG